MKEENENVKKEEISTKSTWYYLTPLSCWRIQSTFIYSPFFLCMLIADDEILQTQNKKDFEENRCSATRKKIGWKKRKNWNQMKSRKLKWIYFTRRRRLNLSETLNWTLNFLSRSHHSNDGSKKMKSRILLSFKSIKIELPLMSMVDGFAILISSVTRNRAVAWIHEQQ